jgi:hypothetical protein
MKKALALIGIMVVASSCRPLMLNMVDSGGPPEYQLGWEDGCDSGLSAEGGWEYKMMYGFKKRHEMAANEQYKQGWNEGFTYCRFSLDSSKEAGKFEDIGW